MACPFSRHLEALPRQATVEGTINFEDLLTDANDDALSLTHLQTAIQLLTFPSNNDIHTALMSLINKNKGKWSALEKFKDHKNYVSIFPNYDYLSDIEDSLNDLDESTASDVLTLLGEELVGTCVHGIVERAFRCLGGDLQEFLCSLDGVHDVLKMQEEDLTDTGFMCSDEGELIFTTDRKPVAFVLLGIFQKLIKLLFNVDPSIKMEPLLGDIQRYRYLFNLDDSIPEKREVPPEVGPPICDLKLSNESFCKAFPWHFILNEKLELIQIGNGFSRLFKGTTTKDRFVSTFFRFKRPQGLPLKFREIVRRTNTPFLVALQNPVGRSDFIAKGLEIKGQMVYCPESNTLLFLGSPFLDGLEGLTCNGLYIADIPIHDATREVILVGEQARAQDGLKRRMDKLKNSIEEANVAVSKERKKNVSLLQLIFPAEIAERLWLGKQIDSQSHDNVTMLFSDIVGFTSICQSATPFQVISMLEALYKDFDEFCGFFDVYKVETIGDAYCVASGLHRPSIYDAHKVAWMSLSMITTCAQQLTHAGKSIQMRIGLHTGTVLAGVVGKKMPRYCLFGNNVTIANKFESGSVEGKINVSPTTRQWLLKHLGFNFELNAREPKDLPKEYPKKAGDTCYFLDGYKHPTIPDAMPLERHIEAAMEVITLDSDNN